MTNRFAIGLALSGALSQGLSAAEPSQEKDTQPTKAKEVPARNWKTLVEHMVANGAHYTTKAPSSRTMGFDSHLVDTRGLYLKAADAKDGREHSFVVYELTDKKDMLPREILLGRIRVKDQNSVKEIDTMRLRLSLDGKPIKGMHAAGVAGKVKHRSVPGDSAQAKEFLAAESKFWLTEVDLAKLVK